MTHDARKVVFDLNPETVLVPGLQAESVWGQPTARANEYVVDSVPFFVTSATLGDVIRVREVEGVLRFVALVRSSLNSLVRVVCFEPRIHEALATYLEGIGCDVEYLAAYNLIAVSIPHQVSLILVQDYLKDMQSSGRLDYEEPILRQ